MSILSNSTTESGIDHYVDILDRGYVTVLHHRGADGDVLSGREGADVPFFEHVSLLRAAVTCLGEASAYHP